MIGYRDGTSVGSVSVGSETLNNFDIFIGAANEDGFSARRVNNRISCAFVGGSLGSTKQGDLYDRLDTFRSAMAAL
jgi:hypothetical protein